LTDACLCGRLYPCEHHEPFVGQPARVEQERPRWLGGANLVELFDEADGRRKELHIS
jgi:hypothetical protein